MDAVAASLREQIESVPSFIIPCYQRPYSWTDKQCGDLWDDILWAGNGERAANHFLGCIICIRGSLARWEQPYLIIDGQQRVTTLMLLHEAMARAIEAKEKFFGDVTADILRKPMCEKNNENKYKIKLSGDDQRHFQDLMRKDSSTESVQSKIIKNFDFFCKKIKSLSDEDAMHFYKGLEGLQAVWILLDKNNGDEDPQYVFENMNFKGQVLVAADLVRNHMIMELPLEKQEELYKEYWCALEENLRSGKGWLDHFIRDYLVAKKGVSVGEKRSKKNYDEFRKHLDKFKATDVLKDMKTQSDYYSNIVPPAKKGKLKHALEDWNRLNEKEGPTPLLLVLYEQFASDAFNDAEFIKIIR